ncbi:MAG: serine hydrolase domain-containing protein [bacterium]|jgi:CubicO group peptidase (beta-lactamase class C family)|nr:serine hydrolase domain-containing protein [bacterium]
MMKRSECRIFVVVYLLLISGGIQGNWAADFSATIESARQAIEAIQQDEHVIGLSVALVSDDDIVWQEGFGYADREAQIPATPDTVYAIGSISKTFTAVSILQQVQQGKIDLDRPISDYFPDFSILHRYGASQDEQNAAITVRRLLNHRSGLPGDVFAGLFLTGPSYYPKYIQWLMDYLSTTYPSQEPGVIANYCNSGFVLAGEIARLAGALAGEDDLGHYFERTLFQPLGMDQSTTHVVGQVVPNLAMGYIGGEIVPPFEFNGVATGGIYSTVGDMSKFLMMLMHEGTDPRSGTAFLAPEWVRELGRMDPAMYDFNTFFNPGLGLDSAHLYRFIDAIPPLEENGHRYGRVWLKDGSTNNFSSVIIVLPDSRLGVVLLFNSDAGDEYKIDLAEQIVLNALRDKLAMEVPKPTLPDHAAIAVTDPSQLTGLYVVSNQPRVVSQGENGTLQLTLFPGTDEETKIVLHPTDSAHYAVEGDSSTYTFVSINNRILLLRSGGPVDTYLEMMVRVVGEKIEPVETPMLWRERLGLYVFDDVLPSDVGWFFGPPIVGLFMQDDAYLMYNALLLPQSDTLAFAPELTSRFDSRLLVDEEGGLLFNGYHAIPHQNIVSVGLGEEENFTVRYSSIVPRTQWRAFEVTAKMVNHRIAWSVDDETMMLRVYGSEFELVAEGTGTVTEALEPGQYYLAVSPGFESASSGILRSAILPPTTNIKYWSLY